MGESESYLVCVNLEMPISPLPSSLLIQPVTTEHLFATWGAGHSPAPWSFALLPSVVPHRCSSQITDPETHKHATKTLARFLISFRPGNLGIKEPLTGVSIAVGGAGVFADLTQ